jgi:hypothetical protein
MDKISKLSEERKMQIRIIFMVLIIFASILLVVLYSAIATDNRINSNQPVASGPIVTTPITTMEFSNDQANVVVKVANGKATFNADVQKPTPCHEASAIVVSTKSIPAQHTVKFTIANKAPADTACIQVLATQKLTGDFIFGEGDSLTVMLDEVSVPQVRN